MPQKFPIQNSGMTLKDFKQNNNSISSPNLTQIETQDGSITLYSSIYKESFHSQAGAMKEANQKFFIPAELDRFQEAHNISILDICLGLGYNTGYILQNLLHKSIHLNWWGIEIDQRPLKIALNNNQFRSNWSSKILSFFSALIDESEFKDELITAKMLWGDAREKLNHIPTSTKFDLILLDAFSPPKCPQLWSEEFLHSLAKKLSHMEG